MAWPCSSVIKLVIVLTLTLNPALDVEVHVPMVEPGRKLRCTHRLETPGGGGLNVSRLASRLGVATTALFPSGGETGLAIQRLLGVEHVSFEAVLIVEPSRENITVTETCTNRQFRFVLPGPTLSAAELDDLQNVFATLLGRHRLVILSGSLPPGVRGSYLGELARTAKSSGARVIVDTSGPALVDVAAVGVTLLKPSRRELGQATQLAVSTPAEVDAAARVMLRSGPNDAVLVSLGAEGALLVEADRPTSVLLAPSVVAVNEVGAGDSLVGGMAIALDRGESMLDAARFGVACGTAAVLSWGLNSCRPETIASLVAQVIVSRS